MASFGLLRSLTCVLVLAAPACVIRLTERNAPEPMGDVTGAPADCSTVQVTPRGSQGNGEPALKFVGRFDRRDPNNVRFDWSGNYIAATFEGPQVSVRIGAPEGDVLFSAVLDGGPPREIHVQSPLAQPPGAQVPAAYLLFESLAPGPHEVILHRDTEAQNGITIFHGFDFGGGRLLAPKQRPRRIEVIGDSISCGYGDEGLNATCPFDIEVRRAGKCPEGALPLDFDTKFPECNVARVPFTENQYLAYGSIVGRRFDADVTTLCWSGKGVERNYREPTKGPAALDAKSTVPLVWRERTIGTKPNPPPGTAEGDLEKFGVPWDFASEPEPQVVLINLGTNDYTRDVLLNNQGGVPSSDGLGDNVPDGDIDRGRFKAVFAQFVADVRAKRPNAHIFIAVPPMITDQFPLDNARQDLITIFRGIAAEFEARGDKKVYAMELVEQGTRYGLGCDYHPNLRVHEIMAGQVADAIRSKTCWD